MFFTRDNIELYYEEYGSGTPLLCLPAFPFDSRMYRFQRGLADTARVITPDYRGTGKSGLSEGPYTMELLAEDQFALLDYLGIEQAVVMGDSMGNYVTFAMYAAHPERFAGLILADTRAEADNLEQAERRRRTVENLRAQGASALADRVNDLFSPTTLEDHPDLVATAQQQVLDMNPEGLAQITLGMAMRLDRTTLLPQIAVPTLVISGEDDKPSPPEGMHRMAEQIPGAQYHLIHRAGHLSPLEQPEIINSLVREFIGKIG